MKCDYCEEKIKYNVIYLELPCYASIKRLAFCDIDCLMAWVDEHTVEDDLTEEVQGEWDEC